MAVVGRVYRGLWEDAPAWVLDGCPLSGIGGEGQPRYFDTARPIVAFECLNIMRSNQDKEAT